MSLVEELKYFFLNRRVTDLAVAVVFGQTFAMVINSLVSEIIIPILNALIYKVDSEYMSFVIKGITINYSSFIGYMFTFIISMLLVFFMFIKPFHNIIETNKEKEEALTTRVIKILENIEAMIKRQSNGIFVQ